MYEKGFHIAATAGAPLLQETRQLGNRSIILTASSTLQLNDKFISTVFKTLGLYSKGRENNQMEFRKYIRRLKQLFKK